MRNTWISFFSQTGGEIVDIAKSLGRWPDLIITNERPAGLRTIHPELKESNLLVTVQNKPTLLDYEEILGYHKNPIITLHGWLRVVPPQICEKYNIFNGHPGLITRYPHLVGKDPQIRAFREKLPVMGCVLHRVTPGVDEGPVIAEERFNTFNITEEKMWKVTRDRSLYLWIKFLENLVV